MLLARLGGANGRVYVDDVFSAWVRTGTGADATITTGIDMVAKGYCLHSKGRSAATDHAVYHSARGVTKDLATNTTAGETTQATGLKSVTSTGHTVGSLAKVNNSGDTYVDWVFRNADKFFNHAIITKSAGSNATVSFANLGTLGMVRVKRTDASGSWYVWHRSLSAGQLLIGETAAAAATLGHVTVSGTTVTLVNGVIADGTYLVEAFAHDPGPDGIIQCVSFMTDSSGNATVVLGWEPQFLEIKRSDSSAGGSWNLIDAAREFTSNASQGMSYLIANTPEAEIIDSTGWYPTATGFGISSGGFASRTYICLAVRRPNKPPTTGTQVYNAVARTGTGAAATVTGVGFAPDVLLEVERERITYNHPLFWDRLRGANYALGTDMTAAEININAAVIGFDTMSGVNLGADNLTGVVNYTGRNYINYFFRRAPGAFDAVCYTGTGAARTVNHNLGVVPELVIVKSRSLGTEEWAVYHKDIGYGSYLFLNTTNAVGNDTNTWYATPTSSVFSVGTALRTNSNSATYVAYLFASLPGISKVGSYTGNGSSQNINCGFSTGARFVLVKRTDSAGDWFVWDTVRGIVAANDPHLSLNTTAAEVTTDDSIDPDASGFIVNQVAATNINVTGASYLFLAIS